MQFKYKNVSNWKNSILIFYCLNNLRTLHSAKLTLAGYVAPSFDPSSSHWADTGLRLLNWRPLCNQLTNSISWSKWSVYIPKFSHTRSAAEDKIRNVFVIVNEVPLAFCRHSIRWSKQYLLHSQQEKVQAIYTCLYLIPSTFSEESIPLKN